MTQAQLKKVLKKDIAKLEDKLQAVKEQKIEAKVELGELEAKTSVWGWIKSKWLAFEAKVYAWWPGFKTRIILALGAIGSLATSMQSYISGLPLEKLVNPTNVIIANVVLFSLAYWLSNMGNRVAEE